MTTPTRSPAQVLRLLGDRSRVARWLRLPRAHAASAYTWPHVRAGVACRLSTCCARQSCRQQTAAVRRDRRASRAVADERREIAVARGHRGAKHGAPRRGAAAAAAMGPPRACRRSSAAPASRIPARRAMRAGDWRRAHAAAGGGTPQRRRRDSCIAPLDARGVLGRAIRRQDFPRRPATRPRGPIESRRPLRPARLLARCGSTARRNARLASRSRARPTRAPRFWATCRISIRACGDHKIIWELNRHQHWLQLGRAWWLTGDARYRDARSSTAGELDRRESAAHRHQLGEHAGARVPVDLVDLGDSLLRWPRPSSRRTPTPWLVDCCSRSIGS